jgi:cytidine deaminase
MNRQEIEAKDQKVIDAAIEVLRKNYHHKRHEVGAAVLCPSGKIYAGVNVKACGYSPCAEPIALGTAISNGEREFVTMVAVGKVDDQFIALPPCGNCRQLLLDYSADAFVIFQDNGKIVKAKVDELLPGAFKSAFGLFP